MPRSIDYYFTLLSPWTYLGHSAFVAMARRHGCEIVYRPTPLRMVFDETGGLPLPKRHPVRQRYRILELQRWREKRGLPLVLYPKHFPFDVSLADRAVIAIREAGGDPSGFVGEVLAGVWARDEDLSRRDLLSGIADAAGFNGAALLETAESEAVLQLYAATINSAITAGVFGAPSYVLDGEVFWGQDRLELLDDALSSQRAAYRDDAQV
ncbi:2-hydroxychromene-2-carboxylate isomerase [Bosea sp. OK403]|jgi:2-hydroxychromene-2-carboxylate isomerase|uniref:2-hydroxychromene-2-carboxylate isomerase n=1 Tax=Bosea sp. OK403 TaxID=1855286 RepID=UPI0008DFC082|nr:2-hydroxychromene-2-carboxylate isomerase [Bosea sp. OK403]SFI34830.1 2-hydroxychromene-2-carboxylate isomerase [Bosea sp. OK403]